VQQQLSAFAGIFHPHERLPCLRASIGGVSKVRAQANAYQLATKRVSCSHHTVMRFLQPCVVIWQKAEDEGPGTKKKKKKKKQKF